MENDLKQCSFCRETFSEEWMARRCEAQGPPPLKYHTYDLVEMGNKRLTLVTQVLIHHTVGVTCHLEGPCPHTASYAGRQMFPSVVVGERAWASLLKQDGLNYRRLFTAYRVLANMTGNWGVITEDRPPEMYLHGPNVAEEWDRLWDVYPEKKQRVIGQRRLLPKE